MRHRPFITLMSASLALGALSLAACERQTPTAAPTPADARGGAGGGTAHTDDHHGGPVIELGTSTFGPFNVLATRDAGEIVAGKDAPIDVTVTTSAGAAPGTGTAVGVRFWIGTEDGRGSVKARAEIEDPAEPNRWHTHAEVPNPIPAGSKLWIEIDTESGEIVKGSFDLHQ